MALDVAFFRIEFIFLANVKKEIWKKKEATVRKRRLSGLMGGQC